MQPGSSIETPSLVVLLKEKSRHGFSILYDNYAENLYGVICKIVKDDTAAEDILQEVFVKVWKNIEQFDAQRASLYTWLVNITRYTAIDYLRSGQRKRQMKNQILTGNEYIEEKPVDFSDRWALQAVVGELEPRYREVIDLIYYYGYTQEEVSKILNSPLGTVKTRARKGLQILKSRLSK
jgi:RNA polymerase sigma-70 factor (ECF subfamily)